MQGNGEECIIILLSSQVWVCLCWSSAPSLFGTLSPLLSLFLHLCLVTTAALYLQCVPGQKWEGGESLAVYHMVSGQGGWKCLTFLNMADPYLGSHCAEVLLSNSNLHTSSILMWRLQFLQITTVWWVRFIFLCDSGDYLSTVGWGTACWLESWQRGKASSKFMRNHGSLSPLVLWESEVA